MGEEAQPRDLLPASASPNDEQDQPESGWGNHEYSRSE